MAPMNVFEVRVGGESGGAGRWREEGDGREEKWGWKVYGMVEQNGSQ